MCAHECTAANRPRLGRRAGESTDYTDSTMIDAPMQTDASTWEAFAAFAASLAQTYWWLGVVILLAWYLRWYGKEMRVNARAPAFSAIIATIKHMMYVSNRMARVVGVLVLGAIVGLGWVFDLIPTIMQVLGAGDPVGTAATVAAVVAGAAGIDATWATPMNTIWAFAVTFAALFIFRRIGKMAQDTPQEADDDEIGNRTGWLPNGFPGGPDD